MDIFKECCQAVKIIHDVEHLHLDIKPENFMIKDNQVKIIDFGIVKENKYETLPTFGTSKYIASDWIINMRTGV
jgi:serine/threonine protein kinase